MTPLRQILKLNNEILIMPTVCPFSLNRSLNGVNKSRDPIAMKCKAINIRQQYIYDKFWCIPSIFVVFELKDYFFPAGHHFVQLLNTSALNKSMAKYLFYSNCFAYKRIHLKHISI